MEKVILKLQRPLNSDPDGGNKIFLYSQERTIEFQQLFSNADVDYLFGDEFKVYRYAEVTKDPNNKGWHVELTDPAPEQLW